MRDAPAAAAGRESVEWTDLERAILETPLPPRVLALPGNASFVVAGVGAALSLFARLPFRSVERLFPAPARADRERPIDIVHAAIALSLTERLLRFPLFPFRRTCLRRSLLLAHLLRESGIEVKICFGVSEKEGDLRGHSWLSREGRTFLETEESWREYSCMFTLPRDD